MTMPIIIFVGTLIIVVIIWQIVASKQAGAWKQLASEIGAEFVQGGFRRSNRIQANIQHRTVVLDTYSVPSGDSNTTYTRMTAPIQNLDGFQFTVSRRGIVSKLDKALGAKEITVGYQDFDHDMVTRGNNESRIRALFMNQRIRQLIQAQRTITLTIKNNQLNYETQGVITDLERLKSLFELFREMLNQLEE